MRGIATFSLLSKRGLRSVRLGQEDCNQGKACVSRPCPLVQAIVSGQTHDIMVSFFKFFESCGRRTPRLAKPLSDHLVQCIETSHRD